MSSWALVLLAAVAAGCGSASRSPGTIEIREAARVLLPSATDGKTLPPDEASFASASRVALPDVWPLHSRGDTKSVWYRARFDVTPEHGKGYVVYLPRVALNAAIWLNGERIGDGGPFAPHLANDSYRPLLINIPVGALRSGQNQIDVLLALVFSYPGALGSFYIGPSDILQPAYEWRTFWKVTLIQISVLLNLYLAVVALFLHRRRLSLRGLRWSALASFLWGVGLLEYAVREPPLPWLAWQWLTASALTGSVASFVLGAHRFLERGKRASEWAVGLVWLAGSVAFALSLVSGQAAVVEAVLLAWVAGMAVVGGYLLRLLFLVRGREPQRPIRAAAPIAVLGFVVASHDVALGLGVPVPPSIALLPYMGTLLAVHGVWRIIELLATSLGTSEELNRDLERRVAERGREIARSYERVRQLEHRDLIQAERERLMRDIHDGLGAQLTSTLAAVESEDTTRREIANDLRDTLDDMRLLVASLAPGNDDLVALLAHWRGRIQRRLERRGARFDWRVEDLPPLPWLGPREALSALRIFQEAVSNALQHANATTIVVATGLRQAAEERPGVFVEIRDNGDGPGIATRLAPRRHGEPVAASAHPSVASSGFGLSNMARRAAELGGTIAISDAMPGTRVVLWLPLSRSPDPDVPPGQ